MLTKMKTFTLIGATLALTATAGVIKLEDRLPELNTVIAEILAPFQTPASKATFSVLKLETDEANLLKLKVTGFYGRVGKAQAMTVNVSDISYDFNNGAPIARARGSAAINLTKLFPMEQIDALVDGAEDMVKDIASNYTKEYGDAVTLDARIVEKTKGADEHYESFKAFVGIKIDLTKLPEGKKAEDIPFTEAAVSINVTLASGLALNGQVALNPGWKGFTPGSEMNPKRAIEKLLARDEAAKTKIEAVIKKVDQMAGTLVDADSGN